MVGNLTIWQSDNATILSQSEIGMTITIKAASETMSSSNKTLPCPLASPMPNPLATPLDKESLYREFITIDGDTEDSNPQPRTLISTPSKLQVFPKEETLAFVQTNSQETQEILDLIQNVNFLLNWMQQADADPKAWKNSRSCDCPVQLLMGAMDHWYCVILGLAIYPEVWLTNSYKNSYQKTLKAIIENPVFEPVIDRKPVLLL
eukprot:jgi/Psemu1/38457/gm1.38457_g